MIFRLTQNSGGVESVHPVDVLVFLLILASFLHVFIESKRDPRIGRPWAHALMCVIVCWPLPYFCWLFWWPGKVRQWLFGTDRDRIRKKIQSGLGK